MEVRNLIIIGSGPAAHTAGIYAGRAGFQPLMFEGMMAAGFAAGGQLTTTSDIENFPGFEDGISGMELMMKMRKQSVNNGVEIVTKTIDKVDFSAQPFKVYAGDEEFQARSVIIATGATAQRLDIEGEKEYWQKGISACAVCDGGLPIFRDKSIFIVGGGDVACEEAIYLTKFASKVHMCVRRDVLRASKVMQNKVFDNKKIEMLWNTNVIKAKGNGTLLTELEIKNNKTEEVKTYAAAGLFYAIGHVPNTKFLGDQIDLDDLGYIKTLPGTTKTSMKAVFACGDVQDHIYRQAITAAGSGCMAAMDVQKYLEEL